ncbi:MAG: trypsin-like peptidase domain-containing protein [Verrucomicrobiae bacterium]|nr:trypsin-like peptidase domain-containing protein [Verrucomicrobiae bacterium]
MNAPAIAGAILLGAAATIAWLAARAAANPPPPPQVADPANEPIVRAVAKTLPAVVNINAERIVARPVADPVDQLWSQFFGQPQYRRYLLSRVPSLGSGFFIHPDGYILTNEHVVERAEKLEIQITTLDGKTYPAKRVYGDEDRDLALLKVQADGPFPCLRLDDLSPNYIGQTVIALGNPIGYQSSVSAGILSGKNRTAMNLSGLLQTDAAINPGNSGGPLVDIAGRLVGVNSIKVSFAGRSTTPAENIAFAIPAETIADWARDAIAIAKGEKQPPPPPDPVAVLRDRFGISVQDLTPDLAQAFGFGAIEGVLVADVEANSPAAAAGIRRGLVLEAVGRYPTPEVAALPPELALIRPGQTVVLTLIRSTRRGAAIFNTRSSAEVTAR